MFSSAYHRLDQTIRHMLPLLLTLIAALLTAVPWPWPEFAPVAPPFALMAVYYWSIHRPDLFGTLAAFVVGLIVDALAASPFGLHALCFVAIHELCLRQRHLFVNHSFFILWFGFAVSAVAVMIIQWLVISMLATTMMPFAAVLVQAMIAILFFPLPAALLIWLQRRIVR
jgi:rod shape-determining protein MreD